MLSVDRDISMTHYFV